MRYTGEILAGFAGMHRKTFMRKVNELIDEGKFKRNDASRYGFSEKEVQQHENLFGFKVKQKND